MAILNVRFLNGPFEYRTIRKPNFETFGFRMDSVFEWSEFEPPLYLKGRYKSGCQMVQYLNGGLKTGLNKACLWSGIQMVYLVT